MRYNQNELNILLESLLYAISMVIHTPRHPLARRGTGKMVGVIKSYGGTMEKLRFERPLFDEDWFNIHNALFDFCDDCLLLPEEIGIARVLMEHLESIDTLRDETTLG